MSQKAQRVRRNLRGKEMRSRLLLRQLNQVVAAIEVRFSLPG